VAGAWRRRLQASRLVALAVLCLGIGSPVAAPPAPVAARPVAQAQLLSGPPRSRDREPDVRLVEPAPQHAQIDSVVRLQFSRRMAMGSVLRSFRIDPAIDGVQEWPDDRTLVFRPLLPLAYQGTYRVSVAGFSRGGEAMALGTFGFATVWRPPVLAVPFTLTFDDCGPPDAIRAILSALADRSLHAIFFPTGQCRDQLPWLVPALLAAGHRVCNHTYSHPDLSRLSAAAIRSEIERGVSVACDLFRPPYGAMDRVGRVAGVAASLGYRVQLWDVDTRDWAGTPADVMVAMIRARGGVVLMHMQGPHTVEAIRTL